MTACSLVAKPCVKAKLRRICDKVSLVAGAAMVGFNSCRLSFRGHRLAGMDQLGKSLIGLGDPGPAPAKSTSSFRTDLLDFSR